MTHHHAARACCVFLFLLAGFALAQQPFTYTDRYELNTCNAGSFYSPATVAEVQTIIQDAKNAGKSVKVVGSTHSQNKIICVDDGGVGIWLGNMNQVKEINAAGQYAVVEAGSSITAFQSALAAQGFILEHTPQYGGITIGGALGTGAHGSTLTRPAALSDQVIGLKFVNGLGQLVTVTDAPTLNLARVNLGLLGVVVEATFRIVPLYKVRVDRTVLDDTVLLDGTAVAQAAASDYLAINWFPFVRKVVVNTFTQVDVSTEGEDIWGILARPDTAERFTNIEIAAATRDFDLQCSIEASEFDFYATGAAYMAPDGTPKNPAVGFPSAILALSVPNPCIGPSCPPLIRIPYYDSSVAVPLSKFAEAAEFIIELLEQRRACFPYTGGIYLRFLKATSNVMSTHHGGDYVMFEIITNQRFDPTGARLGLDVLQEIEQALLYRYHGRPHWGKNAQSLFSHVAILRYPQSVAFRIYRTLNDPFDLFFNDFARNAFRVQQIPDSPQCALYAQCRCDIFGSNDQCASSQFCSLGAEFVPARVCRDKFASGAKCLDDWQCLSDDCRRVTFLSPKTCA